MKRISECPGGNMVSAYIIMQDNKVVAKVQALIRKNREGRSCQVDVFNFRVDHPLQQSKAGYGGINAALNGLTIEGIKLYDYGCIDDYTKSVLIKHLKGKSMLWLEKQCQNYGLSSSNYVMSKNKFTSLEYVAGLQRLTHFGYTVHQAI